MKRPVVAVLALLLAATPVVAETPAAQDAAEDAAIVAVVDRAYVHGVHIDNDPELMRSGMHDSFVMFVQSDKGLTQLTRDAWIERLAASKAKDTHATKPEIKADITVLDRSGKAAVAKVALFRNGKQIFTDYISLYRFDDGWKLVAKTFNRH
jgi:ketosteroid isomerase-like protein